MAHPVHAFVVVAVLLGACSAPQRPAEPKGPAAQPAPSPERLSVGIYAAEQNPGKIRWMVGPIPVADESRLQEVLQQIHDNRNTWIANPASPGALVPLPVVIEPHSGVLYGQVAATVAAVQKAGFPTITFE